MVARNGATGAAPPVATTCRKAASGENRTTTITHARLSCLTAAAIARLTGIDLPLPTELADLGPHQLMSTIAPAGEAKERDKFRALLHICSTEGEKQARQELSLAEEGLANYQQENERLRAVLLQWWLDVGGASERLLNETMKLVRSRSPQSEGTNEKV
jgi:hypothetical protein